MGKPHQEAKPAQERNDNPGQKPASQAEGDQGDQRRDDKAEAVKEIQQDPERSQFRSKKNHSAGNADTEKTEGSGAEDDCERDGADPEEEIEEVDAVKVEQRAPTYPEGKEENGKADMVGGVVAHVPEAKWAGLLLWVRWGSTWVA